MNWILNYLIVTIKSLFHYIIKERLNCNNWPIHSIIKEQNQIGDKKYNEAYFILCDVNVVFPAPKYVSLFLCL